MTNFEIVLRYFQNEPKINGVCSRNHLPKIKDGAYIINIDEYASQQTLSYWTALYLNGNDKTYFENFGIKYILNGTRKFIDSKNITNKSRECKHMI